MVEDWMACDGEKKMKLGRVGRTGRGEVGWASAHRMHVESSTSEACCIDHSTSLVSATLTSFHEVGDARKLCKSPSWMK